MYVCPSLSSATISESDHAQPTDRGCIWFPYVARQHIRLQFFRGPLFPVGSHMVGRCPSVCTESHRGPLPSASLGKAAVLPNHLLYIPLLAWGPLFLVKKKAAVLPLYTPLPVGDHCSPLKGRSLFFQIIPICTFCSLRTAYRSSLLNRKAAVLSLYIPLLVWGRCSLLKERPFFFQIILYIPLLVWGLLFPVKRKAAVLIGASA